ncbi:MAG: CDP-diacylglycerol--glycerol-3-phosphate 3-phosphatidyltransferase [Baekduia sp.]
MLRAENLPNVLTVIRIFLIPVLVAALLDETRNGDVFAAFVFALASVTDFIDGWLARSRDAVSTFGKLMDPIADKLLVLAALFALVSRDRLEVWVAMVIVSRELAVTLSRMAASGQGVIVAARSWGKLKTVIQVATIFFLIAFDPTPWWVEAMVYLTVVVTIVSGLDYLYGLRKQFAALEQEQGAAVNER